MTPGSCHSKIKAVLLLLKLLSRYFSALLPKQSEGTSPNCRGGAHDSAGR